ncbi:MAG: pentapeptide repeat-containing protein [Ktedonobacteraceae bacterium]
MAGQLTQQEHNISPSQRSSQQASVVSPYIWPGTPWRTEPLIASERQAYLASRRAITANSAAGIYPFNDIKLSRADVEWLLATQEEQRVAIDEVGNPQHASFGLDLRGANLEQVNLSNLPLARLVGGRNWLVYPSATTEQRALASIHLAGADLGGAHLEDAFLGDAHMEECFLGGAFLDKAYLEGAHLEGADLEGAHLEGANLLGAHLEGANLESAHLEGANLARAHLEGANLAGASLKGKPAPADFLKRVRHWDKDVLTPANLQGAFLNTATILEDIVFGDEQFGFVSLADIHWGGANLSVVQWEAVTMLGDERRARQTSWLYNYSGAVRAYRQLATALQEQGLNEEAAPFAYRAQVLQRRVLWRQMLQLRRQGRKGIGQLARKMIDYLFSWLLDLCAGYGYKPLRALFAYLLVIAAFMILYYVQGIVYGTHLSWEQLLTVSMTSFHGRSFFTDQIELSTPQAFTAVSEGFVGFIMEVSLIVIFARGFFKK